MFTTVAPINSSVAKSWEDFGDETLASIFQNEVGVGHLSKPVVCEQGAAMAITPTLHWSLYLWGMTSMPPALYLLCQSTHHIKELLLFSGLPPLPDCDIPEGSDLVLFIYGSPVPGIAPGAW